MTHYAMGDDDFDQEDSAGGVCLTPDCVKVAANILTSADLNADPCEDFYQGSIVEGMTWGTFGICMRLPFAPSSPVFEAPVRVHKISRPKGKRRGVGGQVSLKG